MFGKMRVMCVAVCSVKMRVMCVAVCCSVLQCVAVCCSVLQCVAECCSVRQCVRKDESDVCYMSRHTCLYVHVCV